MQIFPHILPPVLRAHKTCDHTKCATIFGKRALSRTASTACSPVVMPQPKPFAGTRASNQPSNFAYWNNAECWFEGKLTKHIAAGAHAKAADEQLRLDKLRNDLEVRLGGAGSPFVPVPLLLKKTKAEAEAYDPSLVHRWEDARTHGRCLVRGSG